MRTAVKLALLSCVAIFIVAGCDDESTSGSSPYVADRAKESSGSSSGGWKFWESENTKLKREIESLRAERDKALADKATAIMERDKAISERDEALKGHKKSKLWLGLLLGVIAGVFVGIAGWMGFAFLRKPKVLTTAEEKESCPRCGMKRTPGETVCRECGTHF